MGDYIKKVNKGYTNKESNNLQSILINDVTIKSNMIAKGHKLIALVLAYSNSVCGQTKTQSMERILQT